MFMPEVAFLGCGQLPPSIALDNSGESGETTGKDPERWTLAGNIVAFSANHEN
jgi:hypothetical protein